uniref:F-box associated domain-containing protein n=1 Tax=Aegilops tauschii TaxID=37682 RepID=M8C985_AEGTA
MARTLMYSIYHPPERVRRRILVVSLLIRDPTTAARAEQEAADNNSVVTEPKADEEPAARRTRSRRVDRLPEEILVWEILVRLPARDILRCRAVCRGTYSTNREAGLPILGRDRGRPVLGFDDYNDCDGFKLHSACDGLVLVRGSDGCFNICNPATRQFAPLRSLDHINLKIAALYLHRPSGEYRILYWKESHWDGTRHKAAAWHILTVQRRSLPKCIGVPSDNPVIVCLHWKPGWLHNYVRGILIFDTVVESFRAMCCPSGSTYCDTRLCDVEGLIGFSCFGDGRTVARIWVLEDYEREVWSFKYHVKFQVESLCRHTDTQHFILSHKGDMLVYSMSARYMFHCDSTGKLLEEFRWNPMSHNLSITGHRFKESLVEHEFFMRRGAASARQPSFFQRL